MREFFICLGCTACLAPEEIRTRAGCAMSALERLLVNIWNYTKLYMEGLAYLIVYDRIGLQLIGYLCDNTHPPLLVNKNSCYVRASV